MAHDPLLLATLAEIKRDIKDLRLDVQRLNSWRAKVMGGSIALSGLITFLVHMTEVYFNLK